MKKYTTILFLIILIGCQSGNTDINGSWIPADISIHQEFIIRNDTIFLSTNNGIVTYTFIRDGNKIWFKDSISFLGGGYYQDSVTKLTTIQIIHPDTLELAYPAFLGMKSKPDLRMKYKYIRKKANSNNNISATFISSNGWNTSSRLILSTDGKYKVQVQNYWEKKTQIGEGQLSGNVKEIILDNLMIAYQTELDSDYQIGCIDCPTYALRLNRNDSIRSFYRSMMFGSELSFVAYPLMDIIQKAKFQEYDKIINFDSTDFLQVDTSFVLKVKI